MLKSGPSVQQVAPHTSASLPVLTPSGSFKSKTKSVMATAKMPSTKAAIRDFSIAHSRSDPDRGVQSFDMRRQHATVRVGRCA